MARAKHTPGPWQAAASPSSIVGWPIVSREGRSIASMSWQPQADHVDAKTYDEFYRTVEANARLVCAAPDLVEAAQAALDMIKVIQEEEGFSSFTSVPAVALRNAIAKARGEA